MLFSDLAIKSMFIPHNEMSIDIAPMQVDYCTICGLPQDFCKYGPLWDKHPQQSSFEENQEQPLSTPAPVVASGNKPSGVINVKISPRVGRRYLTTIVGLDQFDIDIAKACKVFAKKFACGVGKDNETGEIEIQGDVEESIVATITSNWKQIKAKQIVIKRKEK